MCVSAVFRKSRNRGFGRTSMPRALGGSNGRGTNSEQLFAAAYTSYFLGMLRLVAAREGIALRPNAVIRLQVELRISLPRLPRSEADALVKKAHGPNATQ